MKTLFKLIFKIWWFIFFFAIMVEAAPIILFILMMSLLFGGTDKILAGLNVIFSKFRHSLKKY